MSISRIAIGFCDWLNNISPRSQEENKVIQYGMELLLDNIIKFIVILLIGIVLGRGLDTFLVLSVFCGLRLQAGGIHAKTGLGCGFSLLLVWAISILGDIFLDIRAVFLLYIYIVSALVILCCAPRTINIEYFNSQDKIRKKLYSIIVLTIIMVIAFLNPSVRVLLVCPVILEVITLLPKNKTNVKGENI